MNPASRSSVESTDQTSQLNRQMFGRRALLRNGSLVLAAAALTKEMLFARESKSDPKAVRVGVITDLHYADKSPAGSRHYRETLGKLETASKQFAADQPDFVVELGDLIDAADSVDVEQGYLKTINKQFASICDDRHYVLGNHCVDTLTKDEFLGGVGQERSFYSFDREGIHFIVLDACFRGDGKSYGRRNFHWTDANVSAEELEWLRGDLKSNSKPTVVFAHQRLDVSNNHGVKNCVDVRKALEESGNVVAVFQGHSHQNDLNEIGGIHYCTMAAMVEGSGPESNGYSVMDIQPDGTIEIKGFVRQASYRWDA
ncbi:metallophosphoesterase family protein [Rhodopirellula europaea]|jgi:alkaline phosphatase|uniref:Metallophosphoesterase n=1 Tax=Rhodopirellula europaea SH398 TaxID=1263868 RepID=M5S324_9BACT|nr:metallophosphoesterase [Rhodopirellula europaea]EMI25851.1 metallophosphoesterase [Rhodopirellula europaea SH398]